MLGWSYLTRDRPRTHHTLCHTRNRSFLTCTKMTNPLQLSKIPSMKTSTSAESMSYLLTPSWCSTETNPMRGPTWRPLISKPRSSTIRSCCPHYGWSETKRLRSSPVMGATSSRGTRLIMFTLLSETFRTSTHFHRLGSNMQQSIAPIFKTLATRTRILFPSSINWRLSII